MYLYRVHKEIDLGLHERDGQTHTAFHVWLWIDRCDADGVKIAKVCFESDLEATTLEEAQAALEKLDRKATEWYTEPELIRRDTKVSITDFRTGDGPEQWASIKG